MAEFEVAALLESLAADTGRCAPVTASSVRRRGDRRRVAVRAMAGASTVALVGATAGTAYAVDRGTGRASLHTGVVAGQQTRSPAPAPPHHRLHQLRRQMAAARAALQADRARLDRLHARHDAGTLGGTEYQKDLKSVHQNIARERERIQVLRAKIRHQKKMAATVPAAVPAPTTSPIPTPTPTGVETAVCSAPAASPTPGRGNRGSVGSSTPTPTPTPTSITCDSAAAPTPSDSSLSHRTATAPGVSPTHG